MRLDVFNRYVSSAKDPESVFGEKPQDVAQLSAVIKEILELEIPDRAICQGHCAPMDFVADAFFERVQDCIVIGPRNGGKTINFSALEFLESAYKDGCGTCHLGAVLSQAKRAYKYIYKWGKKYSRELSLLRITLERTEFASGSEIEIVPGTINGVNSPHPHKANIDEFELLPWDIYQEALSMPKGSAGIGAATRLATTRKYPNGNAQRTIDEADQRGRKIYTWCIFEVMTRCDCKERRGCCDSKYGQKISYDRSGQPHSWADICQGKAQQCAGYYSFADVLKRFMQLSFEKFASQWLCHRPETEDSTFSEFTRERNVIVDWQIDSSLGFGRGWDFGLDDPTAVAFFQFDQLGNVYQFQEIIESGRLIDDIASDVRQFSDAIAPAHQWEDWGDIAGTQKTGVTGESYISKLSSNQIYVNSQSLPIADGIEAVKKKLRCSNFTGKPQFYVTKNCKKTIEALEMGKWDRQAGQNSHSREKYRHDEHSHILDAIRYFVVGKWPSLPLEASIEVV